MSENKENSQVSAGVSRRALVKSGGIVGLAMAVGGIALPFSRRALADSISEGVQKTAQFGGLVRSTAAAAAPCVCTCVITKSIGSKPITPDWTHMATTRFGPVCVAVLFAAA